MSSLQTNVESIGVIACIFSLLSPKDKAKPSPLVLLLLILAFSCHAHAQSFRIAGVGVFASAALDLTSTHYAISHGAHEMNPLVGNGSGRQALMIGSSSASVFASTQYLSKEHPRMALGIRIAYIASRMVIAGNNMRGAR